MSARTTTGRQSSRSERITHNPMPKTLLQKSKDLPIRHGHREKTTTKQEQALALAWANGKITLAQVQYALYGDAFRSKRNMGAYCMIARAFRDMTI